MNKKFLIITPGDPDGVGPEVTAKAFKKHKAKYPIVCIGSYRGFKKIKVPVSPISFEEIQDGTFLEKISSKNKLFLYSPKTELSAGAVCVWAIKESVQLLKKYHYSALVTGPLSKERIQDAGFIYNGHTGLLAELANTEKVTMMLTNNKLSVSLVTTHFSYREAANHVTPTQIATTVDNTIAYLKNDLGIKKPKIAVCGLNPHAGENGKLGHEELNVITPTIELLKKKYGSKATITGPFPSDTLFAMHLIHKKSLRNDAIVAMTHDQGLIPVKLLDFPNTVNISLGLPFIRTSVDHGTAFAIAGKNKADPSSMVAALVLAEMLLKKRKRTS